MTHLGRSVDPVSAWHRLSLSCINSGLLKLRISRSPVKQTAKVILTVFYKIWSIKKIHSDDFPQADQSTSISAGKTDYKNSFRI